MAHLSDDKTVVKMGHPAMILQQIFLLRGGLITLLRWELSSQRVGRTLVISIVLKPSF
jgi:hypothetical protein